LQLGTPPAADYPFPDEWKDNLIAPPQTPVSVQVHHSNGTHSYYSGRTHVRPFEERAATITEWDVKRAISDFSGLVQFYAGEIQEVTADQMLDIYRDLKAKLSMVHFNLIDLMCKNDVGIDTMIKIAENEVKFQEELDLEEQVAKAMGHAATTPAASAKAVVIGRKNKSMKMLAEESTLPRRDMETPDQTQMQYDAEGGNIGNYPGFGHGFGIGG
jgi:hypothetical protein